MDTATADKLPVPCTETLTRSWLARSFATLAPALRTLAEGDVTQAELDAAADTLERLVVCLDSDRGVRR
jgi:hypothetical protein